MLISCCVWGLASEGGSLSERCAVCSWHVNVCILSSNLFRTPVFTFLSIRAHQPESRRRKLDTGFFLILHLPIAVHTILCKRCVCVCCVRICCLGLCVRLMHSMWRRHVQLIPGSTGGTRSRGLFFSRRGVVRLLLDCTAPHRTLLRSWSHTVRHPGFYSFLIEFQASSGVVYPPAMKPRSWDLPLKSKKFFRVQRVMI